MEQKRRNDGLLGAITGDIVGSRFEWHNCRSTDFELFTDESTFTDDTVMSVAVAEWLMTEGAGLPALMRRWGNAFSGRGYGGMFYRWLFSRDPAQQGPYNSFGNGAGMRVSACGCYARTLEETLDLARRSAEVTHNHPEGIKGAQAIASALFLARTGGSKQDIRDYIETAFGYDLSRTCDEIRPTYRFDETCQGSCPEALTAFLESSDFESAVRLAVSLGGDSDTIACMAGGIAAAAYGIPPAIASAARRRLPPEMLDIVDRFGEHCP